MFRKWMERRKIQKGLEQIIMAITNDLATAPLHPRDMEQLSLQLKYTMVLYNNDNKMTKKTLRLLYHLKRILMDKRAFDFLKVIEYVVAADAVLKKSLKKEIRQRIAAHYLQMATSYGLIAEQQQKSNPFAPGQVLQEGENSE